MKNYKKDFIVFAFCLLTSLNSYAVFEGENLIGEYPLKSGEWNYLTKKSEGMHESVWLNDLGEMFFVVTYYGAGGESLNGFKQHLDMVGKSKCMSFTTKTLSSSISKRRAFITWQTHCQMKGGSIITLQKLLGGGESLYHMTKNWRYASNEQERYLGHNQDFSKWSRSFADTYVCDTRISSSPCPDLR